MNIATISRAPQITYIENPFFNPSYSEDEDIRVGDTPGSLFGRRTGCLFIDSVYYQATTIAEARERKWKGKDWPKFVGYACATLRAFDTKFDFWKGNKRAGSPLGLLQHWKEIPENG